jgi:hypothetical protein
VRRYTGSHHIQIDVGDAAVQMMIDFDCRSVIAVFPKRPLARLAQVVLLRSATGDKLNALGDDIGPGVLNQQMDVIRADSSWASFLRLAVHRRQHLRRGDPKPIPNIICGA